MEQNTTAIEMKLGAFKKPIPTRVARLLVLAISQKKKSFSVKLRQVRRLDPRTWWVIYHALGDEDFRSVGWLWNRDIQESISVLIAEGFEILLCPTRNGHARARRICREKIIENIDRYTRDQLLHMYARCYPYSPLRATVSAAIVARIEKATFMELHRIHRYLVQCRTGPRIGLPLARDRESKLERFVLDRLDTDARTASQLIAVYRTNPIRYRNVAERLYVLRKGRKKVPAT